VPERKPEFQISRLKILLDFHVEQENSKQNLSDIDKNHV